MALSCERYQAFCSPFEHMAKFWPYFITGVSTSVAFLVMEMFSFEFKYNNNEEIANFVPTKLYSDPRYNSSINYFYAVYSIFTCVMIVLFNIKIYWQLRSMKNSSNYKSAKILFFIVLTFLFCNGVRIVFTGLAFTNPIIEGQTDYCLSLDRFDRPVIWHLMVSLTYFFLVVNSSANFLIYYNTGSTFRQELKNMLWRFLHGLS